MLSRFFSDLIQIPADYLSAVNEMWNLLFDRSKTGSDLRRELERREEILEPLREKVWALSDSISKAHLEFTRCAKRYFEFTASPIPDLSLYTGLMSILGRLQFDERQGAVTEVVDRVTQHLT